MAGKAGKDAKAGKASKASKAGKAIFSLPARPLAYLLARRPALLDCPPFWQARQASRLRQAKQAWRASPGPGHAFFGCAACLKLYASRANHGLFLHVPGLIVKNAVAIQESGASARLRRRSLGDNFQPGHQKAPFCLPARLPTCLRVGPPCLTARRFGRQGRQGGQGRQSRQGERVQALAKPSSARYTQRA